MKSKPEPVIVKKILNQIVMPRCIVQCTCCLASSLSPVYLFCSLDRMGSTFLVLALSFRDLNTFVLAFACIDADGTECLRSRVPDTIVLRGLDQGSLRRSDPIQVNSLIRYYALIYLEIISNMISSKSKE